MLFLLLLASTDASLVVQSFDRLAPSDMAFSADSKFLVTGNSGGHLVIWEPRRGRIAGSFNVKGAIDHVAIDGSGRRAVASLRGTERDAAFVVVDLTANMRLAELEHGRDGTAVAISRDGKRVFLASKRAQGSMPSQITCYDLADKKAVWTQQFPGHVSDIELNPAGTRLYAVGSNGKPGASFSCSKGRSLALPVHLLR